MVIMAVLAIGSLAVSSAFMAPMAGSSAFLGRAASSKFSASVEAAPLSRAQGALSALSMKVFDWQRREARVADPTVGKAVAGEFGILGNLSPAPGSQKAKTRKGRGISAGQGATCGFGMRGQKSRSGRPTR